MPIKLTLVATAVVAAVSVIIVLSFVFGLEALVYHLALRLPGPRAIRTSAGANGLCAAAALITLAISVPVIPAFVASPHPARPLLVPIFVASLLPAVIAAFAPPFVAVGMNRDYPHRGRLWLVALLATLGRIGVFVAIVFPGLHVQ